MRSRAPGESPTRAPSATRSTSSSVSPAPPSTTSLTPHPVGDLQVGDIPEEDGEGYEHPVLWLRREEVDPQRGLPVMQVADKVQRLPLELVRRDVVGGPVVEAPVGARQELRADPQALAVVLAVPRARPGMGQAERPRPEPLAGVRPDIGQALARLLETLLGASPGARVQLRAVFSLPAGGGRASLADREVDIEPAHERDEDLSGLALLDELVIHRQRDVEALPEPGRDPRVQVAEAELVLLAMAADVERHRVRDAEEVDRACRSLLRFLLDGPVLRRLPLGRRLSLGDLLGVDCVDCLALRVLRAALLPLVADRELDVEVLVQAEARRQLILARPYVFGLGPPEVRFRRIADPHRRRDRMPQSESRAGR